MTVDWQTAVALEASARSAADIALGQQMFSRDGIYASAATSILTARVTGDANPRFQINADGKLQWGPGSGALDANLYRRGDGSGPKTDGFLWAASDVVARDGAATQTFIGNAGPGGQAGVLLGLAGDTNLYRFTSGLLATDAQFYASVGTNQVGMGNLGGNAGLSFGTAGDTNLYRSAADTLKTDDTFWSGGSLGARVSPSAPLHVAVPNGSEGVRLSFISDASFRHSLWSSYDGGVVANNSLQFWISTASNTQIEVMRLYGDGRLWLGNDGSAAQGLVAGTTNGLKIGTATTQKLGFFNATPIVQPANTVDYAATLVNLGLRASGGTAPASFPGAVTSSGPTQGMGYATGAGGTVTQATSRTTGVTINKICGQITTNNASLAAGAEAEFVVTNSTVAATDVVNVAITPGGTGTPMAYVSGVSAGSFKITLTNLHASTADTSADVINFAVLKAVAA